MSEDSTKKCMDTISEYLARIEPGRRAYAELYLEWLRNRRESREPGCAGIGVHSAQVMRRRIDAMLQGKPHLLRRIGREENRPSGV